MDKESVQLLLSWVMVMTWFAGIAVSKGVLETIVSALVPPYGVYQFVAAICRLFGVV